MSTQRWLVGGESVVRNGQLGNKFDIISLLPIRSSMMICHQQRHLQSHLEAINRASSIYCVFCSPEMGLFDYTILTINSILT